MAVWEDFPVLRQELAAFETLLKEQFGAGKKNAYLDKLSLDIIQSGGKRLRPAMAIGAAMAGEYPREKVLQAAVGIELLHTATLVHDDIIDNAALRRNKPTVAASEGVSTAVFTGDYLLVKAVLALVSAGLPLDYMKQAALGVQAVCVGEVEQYRGRGELPGFKTYLSRIIRKTGVLFAASCLVGAHLSGLPEETVRRAARFGAYYGIAFQIKDDILDISGEKKVIGKPVGSDLKDGIVTLPVLLAAAESADIRKELAEFLGRQKTGRFNRREMAQIMKDVTSSGGMENALKIQRRYTVKAGRALALIPESEGRDILDFILTSTFGETSKNMQF
jgi:heptaprenyl diphosphate synthase